MLASTVISGCSWMDTIPGGSYHPLDEKSVKFIQTSPEINLESYGRQSKRKHQKLDKTDFIVSASGGGQRAAAFTMGVLTELENISDYSSNFKEFNALSEIDYFSSVSGGSWAVGAYLTAMIEHQRNQSNSPYSLTISERRKIRDGIRSLDMSFFSNCLISKINNGFTSINGEAVTYSDIFVRYPKTPKTPYFYANATIQSTHSPFVFSQAYLNYYSVDKFNYCGESAQVNSDIKKLPIAVAVGTSSSVPGFRHTQAHSLVCENSNMKDSYICNGSIWRQYIHLFDGGVYDNHAYKTSFELLSKSFGKNKVLLVIDANADTFLPIDNDRSSDLKMLFDTAMKSTLAANAVTANKEIKKTSCLMGVKSHILKFSDAAGYLEKAKRIKDKTGKDLIEGLDALKFLADEEIKQTSSRLDFENNKYYRVGLQSKTSYKIGQNYYDAVQDLGRLVVRINADDILTKLNSKHITNRSSCDLRSATAP